MDTNVHPALLQRQKVNEAVLRMMQEQAETILRQRNAFLQEREQLENKIAALETENEVLKKSVDTHLVLINDMKFEIESLRSRLGAERAPAAPAQSQKLPQMAQVPAQGTPSSTSALARQALVDMETVDSSLTSDPELAALIKAYRERNGMGQDQG